MVGLRPDATFWQDERITTRDRDAMITIQEKIDRTLRMLHRMEKDLPLLAVRIAPLGKEHRESARNFAEQMMVHTRAELDRLLEQHVSQAEIGVPEAAD
jgi:hypothetical protein